jgi:hypothetical protein
MADLRIGAPKSPGAQALLGKIGKKGGPEKRYPAGLKIGVNKVNDKKPPVRTEPGGFAGSAALKATVAKPFDKSDFKAAIAPPPGPAFSRGANHKPANPNAPGQRTDPTLEPAIDRQAKSQMARQDTNRDGKIDFNEFKNAKGREHFPEASARRGFDSIDTNGDGAIDAAENRVSAARAVGVQRENPR